MKLYDVIVAGGGHAGVEAAWIASKMGMKVLFVTMNVDTTAQMSCNPAIGGLAKSHLVKELDILGGIMGDAADHSAIQFKTLNISKGPAVWALRTQNDKMVYSNYVRKKLEDNPDIDVVQDELVDLHVKNSTVIGVELSLNGMISCKRVIITSGTFLKGLIHIGTTKIPSGRLGESASTILADKFLDFGFEIQRLKTGTPPRISGNSINFTDLPIHGSDDKIIPFSFRNSSNFLEQRPCFVTNTNDETHRIIESNLHKTALFSGQIKGTGPRYCPSIEDKVYRFSEKPSHRLFLEPEGLYTNEYYINGFSSSLPLDIQIQALRTVKGLENAHFVRPAYAIEYDYFPSYQVDSTFETKNIKGLYFAGQINGTSGYEEAAAQGLMAGINSVLSIKGQDPFILKRSEAYIGVLVDDLITKEIREPYRMFTALAEHRLELRHDNADYRLLDFSEKLGLLSSTELDFLKRRLENIEILRGHYDNFTVRLEDLNRLLFHKGLDQSSEGSRLNKLLKRPQIEIDDLLEMDILSPDEYSYYEYKQSEILVKYEGYINRQKELIVKADKNDNIKLSNDLDYSKFSGLKLEAIEKLNKVKPHSVGQAGRIAGISPADISVILINLKKMGKV
ncbi:MAG: tRNA uridine-5-carboxymethylaminomethyl(34) synthesis enzyme MnmG [Candidatus Delongbacteria bacterium]|nr:tRNA uridine-5-carboxymethylaminomethyl(34) synthesis enzyme MnmG [Candidatus Delongbacteria bacterium]MBN2834839.1 tRNA uridine-5-carboxymethylaminomethyl(34) synthesis enzyme MnmG [Candidatus Delongbacteria bacterium]